MWLAEPSNNVQLISILMAFWVISSGPRGGKKNSEQIPIRKPSDQIMVQTQPEFDRYDEFGNLRQF